MSEESNAEKIVNAIVDDYASRTEETPGEANPERIIMDVMAYRELLLRHLIERVQTQNFVHTATGGYLDEWGTLFGITRSSGESDDDYRIRIKAGVGAVAVGTKKAYYDRIVSLPEVADVYIETKIEDITLPPGVTRLYPLQKVDSSMGRKKGKHHTETDIIQSILSSIRDDNFGIIGEQFIFKEVEAKSIEGTIELKLVTNTDKQTAIDAVEVVVDSYIDELSLTLKGIFDVDELERRVRKVDGVRDTSVLTFINVPNLENTQYITRGEITISAV